MKVAPIVYLRITPGKKREDRTFVVLPSLPEPVVDGLIGLGTVERFGGKFFYHVFETTQE